MQETSVSMAQLEAKTKEELVELAHEMGLENGAQRREEIVFHLLEAFAKRQGYVLATGLLEIIGDGYGFLRQQGLRAGPGDVYISQSQIRRFGLRTGDQVTGQVRPPKEGERYFGLIRVEAVNGGDPELTRTRAHFDNLTPMYPKEQLVLESKPENLSQRLIDLVSPLGKGQRGLIVSPPKAGKTFLLKDIANGVLANAPDVYLMIVLAGERPEEVTDLRRSINGEVYSSTFDEPVEDHCRTAEVSLERAKRLVESGKHVVVLLDSLTRLVRAYNLALPSTGRTLSGGIDTSALYPPKRFFGAARNTEEGGSLTIIATCLVDTGSRMDEVIYEEFKGTGNSEIHLERRLAERRVFPAIDIHRSGTRRDELLLTEETFKQVMLLRRMISLSAQTSNMDSTDATERVLDWLRKSKNNKEFFSNLMSEVTRGRGVER